MSTPKDRRYSESHEWFSVEGDLVTIGITQYATNELTDITYVEMKPPGTAVAAGETLGEVESVKTTSDVYAAIAGEVIEVNDAVTEDPSLLNSDPYGAGWLIKIRAGDVSPLETLLDQSTYDAKNPVDRLELSMPAIVRLTDLAKSYRLGGRTVHALRGIDMEITESGFDAIMGPSGSGKSTLLHLMAALDRPDSGRIEVLGEPLQTLSERDLTTFRRRRIGLVFQQFNLIPTLSAIDNVTLPALLDGVPRPERDRRGAELLDFLGLADRAAHRPDALSGGEQQRVALARALIFRPAVLFADEPTGNLDSTTGREILNLLEELVARDGTSIIMVTHEPSAAVHCRRVFLLKDGRIDDSFDVEGLNAAELATRAQ